MRRQRALLFVAVLALLAGRADAQDRIFAADLPACTDGGPLQVFLLDASAEDDCDDSGTGTPATEAWCCCLDGVWGGCRGSSGGGSGDVTAVWGCASGDCSGLTAAAGDSLDASNADYSIPWLVGSSSFPTAEGRSKWDSSNDVLKVGDGSGTKTIYPTAAAPLVAADVDASAELRGILTDESGSGAALFAGTDLVAPWGQYDPFKPPTNCGGGTGALCDEFTSGATLSWTCNGGTITQTYEHGRMLVAKANSGSSQDLAMCSVALPSGSWAMTTHIWPLLYRNTNQCGFGVIRAGTQASPTSLTYCGIYTTSTSGLNSNRFFNSGTSYTTGAAAIASATAIATSVPEPMFWQLRYDAASDTLTCASSWDGYRWRFEGQQTSVTADPPFGGAVIDDAAGGATTDMECAYEFFRIRTDSNKNDSSD